MFSGLIVMAFSTFLQFAIVVVDCCGRLILF